jgi:hypothetical protein
MSAASLLPRQCLARAPANLHDRKGPALISHGHLPALSSFYSACERLKSTQSRPTRQFPEFANPSLKVSATAEHAYVSSLSPHATSLRRRLPTRPTPTRPTRGVTVHIRKHPAAATPQRPGVVSPRPHQCGDTGGQHETTYAE